MTLKNSIVSLLACACAAPLFADGDSEAALLAAADSAKAELSALKAELAARLDSNAVKKTSIANMKSVISPAGWVLAAASGKKSGKPWKAEAVKRAPNVLMDITLRFAGGMPKVEAAVMGSIGTPPDGRPALKVSVDAAVMERTKGVKHPLLHKSEDLGGASCAACRGPGDGVAKRNVPYPRRKFIELVTEQDLLAGPSGGGLLPLAEALLRRSPVFGRKRLRLSRHAGRDRDDMVQEPEGRGRRE
jgi:hypothetical protein